MRACTCMRTCLCAYACVHVLACACLCVSVHVHKRLRACLRACTYVRACLCASCVCACVYTCFVCMHARMHVSARVRTHSCVQPCVCACMLLCACAEPIPLHRNSCYLFGRDRLVIATSAAGTDGRPLVLLHCERCITTGLLARFVTHACCTRLRIAVWICRSRISLSTTHRAPRAPWPFGSSGATDWPPSKVVLRRGNC